jgi:ADP-ribosylglycohydrolase
VGGEGPGSIAVGIHDADTFEEAVLRAVNLGEDADTA